MSKKFILLLCFLINTVSASEIMHLNQTTDYRNYILNINKEGIFKTIIPGVNDESTISYELKIDRFIDSNETKQVDIYLGQNLPNVFIRKFYEKILLTDDSFFKIGNEVIPLTCIYIEGQDNRFLNIDSPLFPKIIFDIYLVANDYSCTGPINPAWPDQGGKEETWDTYIRYKVKDPTIMLPTDISLRLRWNEYKSILVK